MTVNLNLWFMFQPPICWNHRYMIPSLAVFISCLHKHTRNIPTVIIYAYLSFAFFLYFTYFLGFWEFCTMHSDHIYTPPPLFSRYIPPSLTTHLCVHWLQLVLPMYSWVCYHPLEHGQSTRGHTLKKNKFSPRSYQLPMAFEIGLRVQTGTLSGLTLACFTHAIITAVISRCSYTVDPENTVVWVFFVVVVTYCIQIFYSFNTLFLNDPEPWEMKVWYTCSI